MSNTEQPEAMRVADTLDLLAMDMKTPRQAAAELRRLHALNQDLLEALQLIVDACDNGVKPKATLEFARAAIARAMEGAV